MTSEQKFIYLNSISYVGVQCAGSFQEEVQGENIRQLVGRQWLAAKREARDPMEGGQKPEHPKYVEEVLER